MAIDPQFGLCWHCGDPETLLTEDGYLDRHRRADWDPETVGPDRANELCWGGASGGGGSLRPNEPCQHRAPNNPNCRQGVLPNGD